MYIYLQSVQSYYVLTTHTTKCTCSKYHPLKLICMYTCSMYLIISEHVGCLAFSGTLGRSITAGATSHFDTTNTLIPGRGRGGGWQITIHIHVHMCKQLVYVKHYCIYMYICMLLEPLPLTLALVLCKFIVRFVHVYSLISSIMTIKYQK